MDFGETVLFIAALLTLSSCYVGADCTDVEVAQSSTLALKRRLFCDYDRHIQPVKHHTSVTNISIKLLPHLIELYEFYSIFQLHGFIRVEWVDENLSWNKTDYDNLESITISAQSLWLPELQYEEQNDMRDAGHLIRDSPCILSSTGHVLCGTATTHSATCSSDVKRWPFDKHTCLVTIENWSRTQLTNITLKDTGIALNLYVPGTVWELLNASVSRSEYANVFGVQVSTLTYTFDLRRYAGEGGAGVVMPALVLVSLTCLTFLLKSRSAERICIICANLMIHCLYLLHLCSRVAPNGEVTPLIFFLYRDSLLMAGSSLIITIFVRKMDSTSSSPPSWVASVINGVLAKRPGQMLLLSGMQPGKKIAGVGDKDGEEICGPNRWCLLGTLVDYLSLGVCFITSILLLINYLP